MTIGERIQMHRKNKGLSQEDLAQKLYVSRQTVSQWETDQTVPSVDNIYRLKEVLDVSFDEILSDEKIEKEETEEEKPLEEYVNVSTWEEMKFAFGKAQKFDIKKFILLVAFFVGYGIFSIYVEDFGVALGFIAGMLLLVVVYAWSVYKVRLKTKKEMAKNGESWKQEYKLYTDRLEILLYDKDKIVSIDIIKREDVQAFYEDEKYYAFQARNQLFTIKRNLVEKESYFYNFIYKSPDTEKDSKSIQKIISVLLIIVSILSPVFGFMLDGYKSDYFDDVTSANGWMLLLFVPIPLISVLYGIYLKKKHIKNKGNITVGVMILAFLCIVGISSFNMTDYYYSDISRLTRWEEKIEVDFPDNGEIVTSVNDADMEEISGFYQISVVRFSEEERKFFMKEISSDERWVRDFSDNMMPCFDGGYYDSVFDYNLLYNVTTGEVNTPPERSGEYRFVLFKYLREDGVLEFEEYIIDIDMGE